MSEAELFERPTPVQSIDAEFDTWYRAYPRKEARGYALKAFKMARKKATLAQLVNGLAAYVQECVGRERRYIALPATWLNGERWLDEAPKTDPLSDRDYARLRAFHTRGLWLPEWGKRPDVKSSGKIANEDHQQHTK